MSLAVRGFLRIIRVYQAYSRGLPPRCRFLPTCSEYSVEALSSHGLVRGGWYTVRRLAKCHPFGPHGFDPPPVRKAAPERSRWVG